VRVYLRNFIRFTLSYLTKPPDVHHLEVIVVKNEMVRVEIRHDVFLGNEQALASDVSLLQTEMKCSFSDFPMLRSLLRVRHLLASLFCRISRSHHFKLKINVK
jgi:hypothetical protein